MIAESDELWIWGSGVTMDRHAPIKVSVNGQKIVAVATGANQGGKHTGRGAQTVSY